MAKQEPKLDKGPEGTRPLPVQCPLMYIAVQLAIDQAFEMFSTNAALEMSGCSPRTCPVGSGKLVFG